MVDFAIVPERTALVNVDMQNCFVEGSTFSAPYGLVVQDRINRVAAACRAGGILGYMLAMFFAQTVPMGVFSVK
jgi:ureidoacrylate peracid hydrolase